MHHPGLPRPGAQGTPKPGMQALNMLGLALLNLSEIAERQLVLLLLCMLVEQGRGHLSSMPAPYKVALQQSLEA